MFLFLRGKRRRQKRHKIILRLRLGSSRKMRQRILETIRKVTTGNNKTFPFLIAVAMNVSYVAEIIGKRLKMLKKQSYVSV